jgi:hypothetical protein
MKIMLNGVTDKAKWGYAMTQLVEALPYTFTGSIPDGVIGIFPFLNLSGRTVRTATLGSTQSLNRIKYQGCLPEGKAAGAYG